MPENTINKINAVLPTNRRDIRRTIVEWFLDEEPGTGRGDKASRYTYFVEELDDGQLIYLRRPAYLKKGFDFTVNVNETNFNFNIKGKRATKMPSHNHILVDLQSKKEESQKKYEKLIVEIKKVYNCQNDINYDIKFNSGYPVDLILKCLKWLFIEQDIRDWSYSGRNMLYEGIMNI